MTRIRGARRPGNEFGYFLPMSEVVQHMVVEVFGKGNRGHIPLVKALPHLACDVAASELTLSK